MSSASVERSVLVEAMRGQFAALESSLRTLPEEIDIPGVGAVSRQSVSDYLFELSNVPFSLKGQINQLLVESAETLPALSVLRSPDLGLADGFSSLVSMLPGDLDEESAMAMSATMASQMFASHRKESAAMEVSEAFREIERMIIADGGARHEYGDGLLEDPLTGEELLGYLNQLSQASVLRLAGSGPSALSFETVDENGQPVEDDLLDPHGSCADFLLVLGCVDDGFDPDNPFSVPFAKIVQEIGVMEFERGGKFSVHRTSEQGSAAMGPAEPSRSLTVKLGSQAIQGTTPVVWDVRVPPGKHLR